MCGLCLAIIAFEFKVDILDMKAGFFVFIFTLPHLPFFSSSIEDPLLITGGVVYCLLHGILCWLIMLRWHHSSSLENLMGVVGCIVMTISKFFIAMDKWMNAPYASVIAITTYHISQYFLVIHMVYNG